jgi:hypothetical protein
MKILATLPLAFSLLASLPLHAVILANWDFDNELTLANDTTGNGFDGIAGTGVNFNSTGAEFNGTTDGEITVAYSAQLDPVSATADDPWTLVLRDYRPDKFNTDYQTLFSSRSSNGYGTMVYHSSDDRLEFWTGSGSSWNVLNSGVTVSLGVFMTLKRAGMERQ